MTRLISGADVTGMAWHSLLEIALDGTGPAQISHAEIAVGVGSTGDCIGGMADAVCDTNNNDAATIATAAENWRFIH